MNWETFLLDTANRKIDLILVPLFDSQFNKCRSPVKFFDIARLNSVGIYSNVEPYRDFIRAEIDGKLLSNDQNEWLDAIDDLLEDSKKRKLMSDECIKRAKLLCGLNE